KTCRDGDRTAARGRRSRHAQPAPERATRPGGVVHGDARVARSGATRTRWRRCCSELGRHSLHAVPHPGAIMEKHIDRRAFVETLLALPVGLFLVRCGSSSSTSPNATPGQPAVSGGQATYTSSFVQGHDHTFGIALTSFSNPPSGGVSGDTSNNQGHT